MAARFFRGAWEPSQNPPCPLMREGSLAGEGCFLTTCGSLQQTAMPGFTGLRIGEGIWRPYPASMPAGWRRIEIDRIWVRGVPKRLVAVPGRKPQLLDLLSN